MGRELLTGVLLLCGASAAFGATVDFSGAFNADDNVVLFTYSVQNTGFVTVETTSFASGGFSPVLSLFDSSGMFQFSDSGYGSNTDAQISWNSLAGMKYTIALTEYDNMAFGPSLSDGFTEQGNGNFTAQLPFNNPGSGTAFLLPGPEQRTGNWAINFTAEDNILTASPVSTVPEPASGLLILVGAAVFAGWRPVYRLIS